MFLFFFFFNDTATTEIYTLSLHDALPIYLGSVGDASRQRRCRGHPPGRGPPHCGELRSEEHTSELQSRFDLVCRLLLEKKKKIKNTKKTKQATHQMHKKVRKSTNENRTRV